MNIFDWIYPPHCIFCHNIIPINNYNNIDICDMCVENLPFMKEPTCNKCGITIDDEKKFCVKCSKNEPLYNKGWISLEYDDMVKEAIYRFKYGNCPQYSKTLSYIMYSTLEYKDIKNYDIDLIVPVPIHKNRYKKRGYNQAELLSKELSNKLNIPWKNVMLRTKDTKPQSSLSPKERNNNIKDAFEIYDIKNIRNKKILIIDDIYTTGSTIDACTNTLIDTGIVSDIYYYILSAIKNNIEK